MPHSVLVTGGFGFLGRAVAACFKKRGARVVGVGRGHWALEEAQRRGFDGWLNASVTLDSLLTLGESFDCIVHCAGNGSVGYSLSHPLQDFQKTVHSTADLLEFIRLRCPRAAVVYPSSAGVYGSKSDAPIREDDELNPISPYGFHKRIAEQLLESYSRTYGVRVTIIRFFSIYGAGLTKQLLWDAGTKLRAARGGPAEFWGTGDETRDWINSADAAELVAAVADPADGFRILNGASGERCTVRDTLQQLRDALGSSSEIVFNNVVRAGDPRFYHADMRRTYATGWRPRVSLQDGLRDYARWFRVHEASADD